MKILSDKQNQEFHYQQIHTCQRNLFRQKEYNMKQKLESTKIMKSAKNENKILT